MKPHVVYVKELNKRIPVFASNIFDAAIYALGEKLPDWEEADCKVRIVDEPEVYCFRAERLGERVEFSFGDEA